MSTIYPQAHKELEDILRMRKTKSKVHFNARLVNDRLGLQN